MAFRKRKRGWSYLSRARNAARSWGVGLARSRLARSAASLAARSRCSRSNFARYLWRHERRGMRGYEMGPRQRACPVLCRSHRFASCRARACRSARSASAARSSSACLAACSSSCASFSFCCSCRHLFTSALCFWVDGWQERGSGEN